MLFLLAKLEFLFLLLLDWGGAGESEEIVRAGKAASNTGAIVTTLG